jgi:mycofactocin precursor
VAHGAFANQYHKIALWHGVPYDVAVVTRQDRDPRSGGRMPETQITDATTVEAPDDETLVEDDLLVEEVSIDGMCGVY